MRRSAIAYLSDIFARNRPYFFVDDTILHLFSLTDTYASQVIKSVLCLLLLLARKQGSAMQAKFNARLARPAIQKANAVSRRPPGIGKMQQLVRDSGLDQPQGLRVLLRCLHHRLAPAPSRRPGARPRHHRAFCKIPSRRLPAARWDRIWPTFSAIRTAASSGRVPCS